MKRLLGKIISYNAAQRCGYIQVEGYPLILYRLADLPTGYIPPTVGETLNFVLNDEEGHSYASHIIRPEIEMPAGFKAKLKGLQHNVCVSFYEQPKSKQKAIIITALSFLLLCLALIVYMGVSSYRDYQQHKVAQLQLAQQQTIAQQRAALGSLQESVLSEEAKRNLDHQVYGTVKERSETVTRGIDKLNGLLPVSSGQFKCDERKYCHEMRSYEEALYFQRHCRRTKLDNNGNGVPCENDIRWLKK